jgi:hypothetical protein
VRRRIQNSQTPNEKQPSSITAIQQQNNPEEKRKTAVNKTTTTTTTTNYHNINIMSKPFKEEHPLGEYNL